MRVVLIDDSTLFREGLAGLLEAIGVDVVGQARTADDGNAQVHTHRPDVEGRSNAALARQMNVAIKTVEKTVASIFIKLGLAEFPADNRRILAVLAWLQVKRD